MSIKTFIENNEKNSLLSLKNSELLMTNQFQFVHPYDMEPDSTIYTFLDKIDWNSMMTEDEEWLFMLNRQEYLIDLCVSFEKSQELVYLEKGKSFILDWINDNTNTDNWRTIDTGIRLVYWKIIVDYLKTEGLLTKADYQIIEVSVSKQLDYLDTNYIKKYDLSNWGVLITTGFFIAQQTFQECVPKEVTDRMISRLKNQMTIQIQPSGNHWEQSPLYFMEVLRSLVFLHQSCAIKDKDIHQLLDKSIISMYQLMPHFITPNSVTILQGDSDEMTVNDMVQTIGILYNQKIPSLFTEEVSVDYTTLLLSKKSISFNEWQAKIDYLSDKRFQKSFVDHFTGNIYFRNNWGKEADYLHLYSGSLGSGHGHLSLGHVDIEMLGERLFMDSGRYTYVESDIRNSLKESTHHNTVTINEKPFGIVKDSWGYKEVPTSLPNQQKETADYYAVRSMYIDVQGQCVYKVVRTVIYFKEIRDYLIIDQVIDFYSNGVKSVTRQFHLEQKIKAKSMNRLCLESIKTDQKFYVSFNDSTINVEEEEYSPRYNELKKMNRIILKAAKAHQYLHMTTNKTTTIKIIKVEKSDGLPVSDDKCFGIELNIGEKKYLIQSAIEDTYEGHKLYLLDGYPVYGQLGIYKIEGEESKYSRLL